MLEPFPVSVVFCVESPDLAHRIRDTGAFRLPEAPIIDNCGYFSYSTRLVRECRGVLPEVERLRENVKAFVLISDRLTTSDVSGYRATEFAVECRDWFNNSEDCVGGLISLVHGSSARTSDIAGMVDVRRDDLAETVRAETRRVCDGIWLKSKVRLPNDRTAGEAIEVRLATGEDELRQAFELRFELYNALGYLDSDVAANRSRIEVDSFDSRALHFVAVARKRGVVGAVRLITNVNPSPAAIFRSGPDIIEKQQSLIAEIVADEPILRAKNDARTSTPFPILENSDFEDHWPEFLDEYPADDGGELSRLVVAPRYRSLGISKLLVRMVNAVAIDLGKQYVILECVPQHVGMYKRHQFVPLQGHHCRAQDLDQFAVGMVLKLSDWQFNKAFSVASKDLNMLQHTAADERFPNRQPFVCLCPVANCWENGFYAERGRVVCPLRDLIRPRVAVI
jgi:GNAT superfamily N-acetyltransferase